MSNYVILPKIVVQHINVVQNSMFVSPHSMTAIALFLHAMSRKTEIEQNGFAFIQHDAYLDADEYEEYGRKVIAPHQKKGGTFFDDADYSSHSPGQPVVSLQPTVSANIDFSLILRYGDTVPDLSVIEDFLRDGKFQGGRICSFGRPSQLKDISRLRNAIRTGYFIVDRRDLLLDSADKTEDMLSLLLKDKNKLADFSISTQDSSDDVDANSSDYRQELSTATVGYAFLSDVVDSATFRQADSGQVKVGLTESLVGLVSLVSVHDTRLKEVPFWTRSTVNDDVFLLTGEM
jgi:hypothetical protein